MLASAKRGNILKNLLVRPDMWLDFSTGANPSRHDFLQTNELLEGILSFLPPRQLFVDQRFCKQWRDVVATSPELQKKMFLRVDEAARQNCGLKALYTVDLRPLLEVQRFVDTAQPLPRSWRQVTPVVLGPYLRIVDVRDGGYMGTVDGNCVAFQLPCSLPVRRRVSMLDTYLSNQQCYDFTIYLDFMFEPPIPGYGNLCGAC
jgi:hypothetical protein